jgi:tRNA nucleotidyltransferase (CCA-adding enzyme)
MKIILTHEQADFDALGALLGAYLLNENAFPVLPRRMNRNARAFLNIYGSELPFIESQDLPAEPIEQVTLVDTQSLITIKGLTQHTSVHVVDHHPLRADLPADWTITMEHLGACTTLLVDSLREHNGHLDSIHATLLLLGIYEDTGSMSYASTTPRDVHAAAYLLEQGGSLRIAGEFLNPPLSVDQRELYDRLLSVAEPVHIHGQNILISCTNAGEMAEEISSVAHKLRDLLDPDALFILVQIPEGIRLVARSTSDRIDVSAVAAHFGGGGHERAAAALIRLGKNGLENLEDVRQALLKALPDFIHPSITIGQIMSRQPRILSPDTSAQEASALMQRYGYEGYPVVNHGKVVGLLTRRSVDRAISHNLNLPVASLMDAGEVTVFPQDTIDQLQNIMSHTGWGQVPVVEPVSGKVVGIVTRTDLIKNLAAVETGLPGQVNLAARLDNALPATRLAFLKMIAARARSQHQAAYIVGGFVRDLLLERPSQDFDIVIEGDAIQLARSLSNEFGGQVTSHSRFGTAKWQISSARAEIAGRLTEPLQESAGLNPHELPSHLDFISARTEFYDYPTALPTVERSSIKMDLHRRDFTFNTMAVRLDGYHYGELYDYWSGLPDLKHGLVRVLHSLSFVDDPTRLLRAVRFEQRFGFQIEARTLQLMGEALELLHQVSGDRLRHELDLILVEEKSVQVLERLNELQLLKSIHPALSWPVDLSDSMRKITRGEIAPAWNLSAHWNGLSTQIVLEYLLWFSNISEKSIFEICDRLRFPAPLRLATSQTASLRQMLSDLLTSKPSQVAAKLNAYPAIVIAAMVLAEADKDTGKLLLDYYHKLRPIHPLTSGTDLQKMGIPQGPVYRTILETLRAAWLDGDISSPGEEKLLLEKLLKNPSVTQAD